MNDPHKKDSHPKYMDLGNMSQFELSEYIDNMAKAADQQVHPEGEDAGLELVLCQMAEHIHDVFGVGIQPNVKAGSDGQIAFDSQVHKFVKLCAKAYRARRGEQGNIYEFRVQMTRALEGSFLDALDILRVKNQWRFDVQHRLEEKKGHMVNGLAQYTFETQR